MITEIANSLYEKFLKDKCYIDCWGGLVRTIEIPVSKNDGKGGSVIGKYPISCEKLDECKPNKPYTELLPSNKYKSLSYFELIGRVRPVVNRNLNYPKRSAITFTAKLRFVMWYNMLKLGYKQCSIAEQIITDIQFCFMNGYSLDAPYNVPEVKWSLDSFSVNDINDIFGKYSYSDANIAFALPPYEFFAIDVNVTFTVLKGCLLLQPFACKEPIIC